MSKSPNVDCKKNRQARNCLYCDNGDWVNIRTRQCCCSDRARAAYKSKARREIADELTLLWEDEYAKVTR